LKRIQEKLMQTIKKVVLLGVMAIGLSVSSLANAGLIYATDAENISVGSGQGTSNDRGNINNAFGAADGLFYEMGIGGSVDFLFGNPAGQLFSGNGFLTEVTFGNPLNFLESVDIYVGYEGVFTFLTSVVNTGAQSGFQFMVNGFADTLRLVDTTAGLNTPSVGGFDVDSISVTEVSAPGTMVLLGAGLFLIGMRKRLIS
jgi:hypothetical protein